MRRKIFLPVLAAAGALALAGPALAQGYRQNYGYAAPNDPMARPEPWPWPGRPSRRAIARITAMPRRTTR